MQGKLRSSVDFPDPRETLAEGILAIGGSLDVGTLYSAYSKGIFPWPQPGLPMLWFSPEERGVLEFRDFHVPESLRRFRKRHPEIHFSVNQDFHHVLEECSKQPRPGQDGTWITGQMKRAYLEFFKAGYCMSVEVRENNVLIGGIYGVLVEGVFSGESMFYRKPNASKLALWRLVEVLSEQGHEWIDVQMVTPVVASMGGKLIDREQYLEMLEQRHFQFETT
ncbi:leucyl/phenylalanyl-tRNA--protein transferase [Bdellovibrio bacteriovorus]|uniref:Leucyl/phenylalanyl-tRNA--protein transferase n=1 Tax=Bdellovibrio bacteriovorus str. Tiberius TaxID=1069642 RepID=K7YVB8_BDEBC|nr:leucyl/phenylalanyl-tRNA--protein transferase [Bdellovibrio bacteriovorus]AFY00635.1 leucyl/phenylalanyl-tRNA--protein transferase [Bdellovibrio bacteriovorus str. Tiberius]